MADIGKMSREELGEHLAELFPDSVGFVSLVEKHEIDGAAFEGLGIEQWMKLGCSMGLASKINILRKKKRKRSISPTASNKRKPWKPLPEDTYAMLKQPVDPDGFLLLPQAIQEMTTKPEAILVRDSYRRLYRQVKEGKRRFTHISGNPGTGKTCCIWYFVHELVQGGEHGYVIVQLVRRIVSQFIIISPDGKVSESHKVPYDELREKGTWLLIDQEFPGHIARNGMTVLFASPSKHNGVSVAEKTTDEVLFRIYYMDAWKPAELLRAFKRRFKDSLEGEVLERERYEPETIHPPGQFCYGGGGYSAAAHFLARLYACGGIARLYFQDLDVVMGRQERAVQVYVETGREEEETQANGDDGQKPHKVFYSHPSYSLREVKARFFVSPFVRQLYSSRAFEAGMQVRQFVEELAKKDKKFAAAAGDVFEVWAHYYLSTNTVRIMDDYRENSSVLFKPLERYTYYGSDIISEGNAFVVPLFRNFGIVDSYVPKFGLLLQMSRARSRKLMDKDDFNKLVKACQDKMTPGAVIIDGLQCETPVFVHVRPNGSKATKSLGLREPVMNPDGSRKFTLKGNPAWKKIPLPIPELTITLPAMDAAGNFTMAFEKTATALLAKMQEAVKDGHPLFPGDELGDICQECGESVAEGDCKVCDTCTAVNHVACWPKASANRCLTCYLSMN